MVLDGTFALRAERLGALIPLGGVPQKAIAVMPFLDLTSQQMNEEYFADGMAEELIDRLSKIPGVRVPAPTASRGHPGGVAPSVFTPSPTHMPWAQPRIRHVDAATLGRPHRYVLRA